MEWRPATASAVKTTVSPDAFVAATSFIPGAVPSVHPATLAIPAELDSTRGVWIVPPPLLTLKVTTTPATAWPLASRTVTEGTSATGVPTIPVSCVGEAAESLVTFSLEPTGVVAVVASRHEGRRQHDVAQVAGEPQTRDCENH
jgi:hypothetical protein